MQKVRVVRSNGKVLQRIYYNTGQYHKDIERVHTMPGGRWCIIFTNDYGHYSGRGSKELTLTILAGLSTPKVLPKRRVVQKKDLAAFGADEGEAAAFFGISSNI